MQSKEVAEMAWIGLIVSTQVYNKHTKDIKIKYNNN